MLAREYSVVVKCNYEREIIPQFWGINYPKKSFLALEPKPIKIEAEHDG